MEKTIDFLDKRGKIRFLEDRLEFDCKLEQSFGHPDEYKEGKILYASIPSLALEPKDMLKKHDEIQRFRVFVPKLNKTIVFFVSRQREGDVDPTHDETLHGPYLEKEKQKPLAEPGPVITKDSYPWSRGGGSFDMNPDDPNRPYDRPDGH